MKLNCRPGDLAIVVKDRLKIHLGKIVTVTQPGQFPWSWRTEPPLRDPDGVIYTPEDACLRPIRDPGDDAKDESLTWKRIPEEVE
jgi:hypothetical protein